MAKIYISYSHEDKDYVRDVAAALKRLGAEVAIDNDLVKQGEILDYVHHRCGDRDHVPQKELERAFRALRESLYYRLEHLRHNGFISREQTGSEAGKPVYGWKLSKKYRADLGMA